VRRRLAAYRLTAAGGALLFILGAAVIVLLRGPRHDEGPALIVIVLVLFAFLMGSGKVDPMAVLWQSLSERRERFHPDRRQAEQTADPQLEEEASRREREAYDERGRGTGPGL